MRKFIFIFAIIVAFASCSNKPKNEEAKKDSVETSADTTPEFASFDVSAITLPKELKDKVEVIDAQYKIMDSYKDLKYVNMRLTFKLKEHFEDISKLQCYRAQGVKDVKIDGIVLDEKGIEIRELNPWFSSMYEPPLDNFLQAEPGETRTIELSSEKISGDRIEDYLKKAKQLKIKMLGL